jgi:NAD(P)-dependent dehydrogenase (short-subunit alcohol dehydrogenase family)
VPGTIDDTVARIEAAGGRRSQAEPAHEADVIAMSRTWHYGRLDLLVNNAAITFVGGLRERRRYFPSWP